MKFLSFVMTAAAGVIFLAGPALVFFGPVFATLVAIAAVAVAVSAVWEV